MWCASHVLHHISCTAWCRSHACIKGSQFYSLHRQPFVEQCTYSAGYLPVLISAGRCLFWTTTEHFDTFQYPEKVYNMAFFNTTRKFL